MNRRQTLENSCLLQNAAGAAPTAINGKIIGGQNHDGSGAVDLKNDCAFNDFAKSKLGRACSPSALILCADSSAICPYHFQWLPKRSVRLNRYFGFTAIDFEQKETKEMEVIPWLPSLPSVGKAP